MASLPARHLALCAATAAAVVCAACADTPVAPRALASAGGPAAARAAAQAAGRTVHRPITDFIATQGTFCVPGDCPPLVSPFPAFVTWTAPSQNREVFVDYAGVIARYIAEASGGAVNVTPRYEGTITERRLNDGRVEVHVNLRVSGALAGAAAGLDTGFPQSALIFGNDYQAVLAGATPALADVHLQARFITTAAGAPLPDLVQIMFVPEEGQQLLQVKFHATATGPLHALFGAPEGTLGRLTVQQIGILNTKAPSKATDPYPVEFVNVHAIGPR